MSLLNNWAISKFNENIYFMKKKFFLQEKSKGEGM